MKLNVAVKLFFVGILLSNVAQAQRGKGRQVQRINVELNQRVADVEQQQLLQVLPLFMIKDDTIHQPVDISADKPGMKLQKAKIVSPLGIDKGIHAYGFCYNQHGKGLFPNHTLIYVERPSNLQTQPTRVWADRNHDLDLSNDPFVTFYPKKPLQLPLDSGKSSYWVELSLFNPKEFSSFQNMYKSAIDLIRGERVYFGTQFSFREKRLNTTYGVFTVQSDSIFIGFKDINSNGSCFDEGIDWVVLSNSKDRFELDNSKPLKKGMSLNWLGRSFALTGWNEQKVAEILFDHRLKPSRKEIKNSNSLLIGQRLPNRKFCLAVKKKNNFTKTRKRFYRFKPHKRDSTQTLLVIWNAYDKQWESDSAAIHQLARINKNQNNKLKVIMLNYGGSGKYVHRYNQRFELNNAIQGFCSAELARTLKIQTMPQYFLLDPQFKIIAINPKEKLPTQP